MRHNRKPSIQVPAQLLRSQLRESPVPTQKAFPLTAPRCRERAFDFLHGTEILLKKSDSSTLYACGQQVQRLHLRKRGCERSEYDWDGRDRKSAGSGSTQRGIVAEEGIGVRRGVLMGICCYFPLPLTRRLNICFQGFAFD